MLSWISPQHASQQDWARERNFDDIPCSTVGFNATLKSVYGLCNLAVPQLRERQKENMGSICRQHIHNSSKKCVSMAFKSDRNGIPVKEQKLLTLNLRTKDFLFLPVFSPPSFNKAHSYGTHSSKLINCFKALIHRLSQKSSKFLVIKDFQIASYEESKRYSQ